ncbi:uncharacterized protein LOC118565794 isoform X1 [Fundulus heteroclitus]|uniref:uncharacterized protein LOC118565794 isoform X1 n=1 Tax=Fundulus heteroclitus TaxID=8078 RepID=UPI00165B637D|nr:uncharacterized protein LOC118565794 isoform X1 [Fundulus heteroclitus]XP_036002692.1 uncharacterized protein LOC118565794 isoform X1 [Fundulus heteroclitus]
MICRILLLIILNSCLCAATFVVNVTQSSYQAEENHSITLEWTFTTTPDGSWRDLFIYCSLLTPRKELVLYQVLDGVEVSESQDEQFSGRVQSDKDVLREGRIRLHVSRLRTEDSGQCYCDVKTDDGSGSAGTSITVSEPKSAKMTTTESAPQNVTISTGPRSRLPLCVAVISFIISLNLIFIFTLKTNKKFKEKLLRQASTLECGCLAQEQVCVHVDGSSMRSSLLQLSEGSDSNQQLQHQGKPGEELSLQSEDHG